MLDVVDLSVAFGRAAALDQVSLTVSDKEVLAVLGSNGAGKSTLLLAISGVLGFQGARVTRGQIMFDGRNLTSMDASAVVRAGVVHVPEGRRIFGRMTVADNLRAGAAGRRRSVELDRVLGMFPRLEQRLGQPAGLLSGGEQQMLALGRAIMARPKLLLLDEPSLGLAPTLVEQVADVIRTIHAEGTAVVIVEQNVGVALSVADRGVVLQVGRTVLSGSATELRNEARLQSLYLGGDVDTTATSGSIPALAGDERVPR